MSEYMLCIAAVVIIAAVLLCIWKKMDLLHALGSAAVVFTGIFVALSAILRNMGYFRFGLAIIGINAVAAVVLTGLLLTGKRPHFSFSLRKNAFSLAVGFLVLLAAFLLLENVYAGTDGFAGKAQTKALWLMYSTQEAGPSEETVLLDSYLGQDLQTGRQILSSADLAVRENCFGLEYLFLLSGRLAGARLMIYGMAVFAALAAYAVSMCFSKKRLMAAAGCLGVLVVVPVSVSLSGAAQSISWKAVSVIQEMATPFDAVLLDETCAGLIYMPVKSVVTSYVLPTAAGIEQGNRGIERFSQETGNQIEKTFYITGKGQPGTGNENEAVSMNGMKLLKQLDGLFVYECVPSGESREDYPVGSYYRQTAAIFLGLLLFVLIYSLLSVWVKRNRQAGTVRHGMGIILLAGGIAALLFTAANAGGRARREQETAPFTACLTVRDVLAVDFEVGEAFLSELEDGTGAEVIKVQGAAEAAEVCRLRGEHAYYLSAMKPEQVQEIPGLEKTVVRFMNTDKKNLVLYQCN